MRKGLLIPAGVLGFLLLFCLWNSAAIADSVSRWQSQLEEAETLSAAGDWEGTLAALQRSYDDWSARQTYLHIVGSHDTVDDAEAMYRRALAFTHTREDSELRAELADLRDQLRLLAEMEEFRLGNVL